MHVAFLAVKFVEQALNTGLAVEQVTGKAAYRRNDPLDRNAAPARQTLSAFDPLRAKKRVADLRARQSY
jgi:hypothetical protein